MPRNSILATIAVCKNCLNYDKYDPCEPFLRNQPCTGFEPIDVGDPVEIEQINNFEVEEKFVEN